MTYARSRLILGISNVGFWVVLSTGLLLLNVPNRLSIANTEASFFSQVLPLASYLLLYVLISAPFDILGGYVLPKKFNRTELSFFNYAAKWFIGSIAHGLILLVFASGLLFVSRSYGAGIGFFLFSINVLLLLIAQPIFSFFVSGRASPPLLSAVLTQEEQDLLEKRRELSHRLGLVLKGRLLAFIWTLIGACMALVPSGSSLESVSGIVTFSLYFTLWSFVGLLTLPTANRKAVYWLDKEFLRVAPDKKKLSDAILAYDETLEDEKERPPQVETIFHPIPAAGHRVREIQGHAHDRNGTLDWWSGWHVARYALYCSWAGLGLLSRAVHCNVGKPENWVYLPSD